MSTFVPKHFSAHTFFVIFYFLQFIIFFLCCPLLSLDFWIYCPESKQLLLDHPAQMNAEWINKWKCNHIFILDALFQSQSIIFYPSGSLLVMLYCLSRASSWSWSCLSLSVDPEDFLVSVGVIIFSYTSQIFLPPLEGSMEDRGQFDAMLGWTHGAACIMKTTFSLLVSDIV